MISRILPALILFVFSVGLQADTSVWKVSSENHHLFLVGTMHVLGSDDYPLPIEFDSAYRESTHLVFETDMADMATVAFQQRVMQTLLYQDGTTLNDHLSANTLQALKSYLTSKNIPVNSMMTFKPGMLLSVLTILELQSVGIDAKGVDAHYYELSQADGKMDSGLESTDEQIGFLADMGMEDPDRFVRYLLEEMGQLRTDIDRLRRAWRDGDMTLMDTLFIDPMEQEYPKLYQQLLIDRNLRWIPQIETFLEDKTVEMVLVGAAHLAGEDGLLTLLRKQGYRVERH